MCGSYVTLRISNILSNVRLDTHLIRYDHILSNVRLTCYLDAEVVLSNKWAHGDSVAWAIEHRGIVSFCNELWNVMVIGHARIKYVGISQ